MGKVDNVVETLYRLNGYIVLITGNHDTSNKLDIYREHPDKVILVRDYNIILYNGKYYVMNHYPLEGDCGPKQQHLRNDGWKNAVTEFQKLQDEGKEVYYLYGHIHSNAPHGLVNNTFHVGVDTNNLTPVLLDDIVE